MTRQCALCSDRPAAVLHTTTPPLTNRIIYEVLGDPTVTEVRLPLCSGCDYEFSEIRGRSASPRSQSAHGTAMDRLADLIATLDEAPIAAASE